MNVQHCRSFALYLIMLMLIFYSALRIFVLFLFKPVLGEFGGPVSGATHSESGK